MNFTLYFKYKKTLINMLIFVTIFYLLIHSNIIINSITTSTNIFITKLIPSLFPYLLITELLINSGTANNLSYGLSDFISKTFNIPKNTTSTVAIGFLLGYPNSAKYILNLYKQNQISTNIATKLIAFTSNANMSYIIAGVGISIFKSSNIGIILTISHFLAAIIIGIFLTPSYNNSIIQQTNTNSNSFAKIYSSFDLLYTSIFGTLKTLSFIFAYTVIFSLVPALILNHLNLPEILKVIISGLFELSSGITNLYLLDIHPTLKLVLTSFLLSFSSFMILVQIFSFITRTNVKFKDLVKYKLLQGILAAIITFFIIKFVYSPALTVFQSYDNFKDDYYILPSTAYIFTVLLVLLLSLLMFRKKRQG